MSNINLSENRTIENNNKEIKKLQDKIKSYEECTKEREQKRRDEMKEINKSKVEMQHELTQLKKKNQSLEKELKENNSNNNKLENEILVLNSRNITLQEENNSLILEIQGKEFELKKSNNEKCEMT